MRARQRLITAFILLLLGLALGEELACGSSSLPAGAFPAQVVERCSQANTYLAIPVSECPPPCMCSSETCSGAVVYALCDGTQYANCSCVEPGPGWTAADAGANVGAPDGSLSDASSG